eukprot:Nk52_evm36s294 gene=Nk52_evmTU36s294
MDWMRTLANSSDSLRVSLEMSPFIQGFIVGQTSLILLLVVLVYALCLREPTSTGRIQLTKISTRTRTALNKHSSDKNSAATNAINQQLQLNEGGTREEVSRSGTASSSTTALASATNDGPLLSAGGIGVRVHEVDDISREQLEEYQRQYGSKNRNLYNRADKNRKGRSFGSSTVSHSSSQHVHQPSVSESKDNTYSYSPLDQADAPSELDLLLSSAHALFTSESCQWLNTILYRIFADIQCDLDLHETLLNTIIMGLNDPSQDGKKPSFVGDVNVSEFDLGSSIPIVQRIRLVAGRDGSPVDLNSEMYVCMDIEYSGNAQLGIETELILNWPVPMSAALPVGLSVSIAKLEGVVMLKCPPCAFFETSVRDTTAGGDAGGSSGVGKGANASQAAMQYGTHSLYFDSIPRIDFEIHSVLGHKSQAHDLPKLEEMILDKLRDVIVKTCVYPNSIDFDMNKVLRANDFARKPQSVVQTSSSIMDDMQYSHNNTMNMSSVTAAGSGVTVGGTGSKYSSNVSLNSQKMFSPNFKIHRD